MSDTLILVAWVVTGFLCSRWIVSWVVGSVSGAPRYWDGGDIAMAFLLTIGSVFLMPLALAMVALNQAYLLLKRSGLSPAKYVTWFYTLDRDERKKVLK